MGKNIYLSLLLFFSNLLLPSALASYTISPTHIKISNNDPIGELNIKNRTDSYKTLQLMIKKRNSGQDKQSYSDTKDIIISPIICKVPPNGTQLVRLKIKDLNLKLNNFNRGYKLVIKELPTYKILNSNLLNLSILLNMEVPVTISKTNVSYSQINKKLSKK